MKNQQKQSESKGEEYTSNVELNNEGGASIDDPESHPQTKRNPEYN